MIGKFYDHLLQNEAFKTNRMLLTFLMIGKTISSHKNGFVKCDIR